MRQSRKPFEHCHLSGCRTFRSFLVVIAVCLCTPAAPLAASEKNDHHGRSTAVALNYCRASFHRIKRFPSKRVLIEEQEKILNNLNLNEIDDEEVVRLYTGVLDEIAHVQIAAKEREVIRQQHKRVFRQQIAATALQFGTHLATGHYMGAVRAGAGGWWDYRGIVFNRELDLWKVDKTRMTAVVDKSSAFLDTFWKLTRKRNIPDRWLVRGNDLDKLDEALKETDLETRLRVLKRMENFMECYPPYWYYVGRTQQGLGKLFAAAETYRKLAELGGGHFRKDEMLAAALANRAVIQDHLQQADAPKTAEQALGFSNDVWQANLICARVLGRHGKAALAEDAILRNLDVDLETEQSLSTLVLLYCHTKDERKLVKRLQSADDLARLPIPVLLHCANVLGREKTPEPVRRHLNGSMYAYADLNFGRDDLVLLALPSWNLQQAKLSLTVGERRFEQSKLESSKGHTRIRFREIGELGTPLKRTSKQRSVVLTLEYPDDNTLRVHLQKPRGKARPSGVAFVKSLRNQETPSTQLPIRENALRIVAVDLRASRIALAPAARERPKNSATSNNTDDGTQPKIGRAHD